MKTEFLFPVTNGTWEILIIRHASVDEIVATESWLRKSTDVTHSKDSICRQKRMKKKDRKYKK